MQVVGVISDLARATDMNRPGFQRLLRKAADGTFDVILVKDIDWLVRGIDQKHILINQLHEAGVKVFDPEWGEAPNMLPIYMSFFGLE